MSRTRFFKLRVATHHSVAKRSSLGHSCRSFCVLRLFHLPGATRPFHHMFYLPRVHRYFNQGQNHYRLRPTAYSDTGLALRQSQPTCHQFYVSPPFSSFL
jgi:hypothetical protein